jgi:hypothetical protein
MIIGNLVFTGWFEENATLYNWGELAHLIEKGVILNESFLPNCLGRN